MRKIALTIASVTMNFVLLTVQMSAQDLPRFSVEGRFGSIHIPSGGFLNISEGNHFSAGILGSYRHAPEDPVWGRFTFRMSFDGAGIGGEDIGGVFKQVERLYLVNFALGLDVVQRPRFLLTPHAGAAIARDRFVLQAFSSSGGAFGGGGFVSICNQGPNLCQSVWNFLGNFGVGGRGNPVEGWPFFVGGDYTRFAGAKHQLVFLAGIDF
ncbi:MAG: hypothetical protein HY648_04535 [Acidobacteria bacterium]|nr:hypothetical protein [Acidobacteriota bacterium]